MHHTPLVSVVIPTYNHENHVLETLRSVFAQTFTDYEIIVINDGSSDNTARVLRPLVSEGKIRYFEQLNGGQASARNHGLRHVRGEFIALLDDDDLWPPDKLEWQVAMLQRSDVPLIGGAVALFKTGEPAHLHLAPRVDSMRLAELADGCPFVSPGQTLIRNSALQQIGGFDTSIWGVDDFDLYLRLEHLGELKSCQRVSLLYRLHPGNASKNRKRMLKGNCQVINRHFSALGGAISQKAYRSLYMSVGREWVLAARRAIRNLQLRAAFSNLFQVRCFGSAARKDFVLARQMLTDLLPERFFCQTNVWKQHLMVEVEVPSEPTHKAVCEGKADFTLAE